MFTARFDDFLKLVNGEGRGEGDWYRGSWSLWHNSNWRSKLIFPFFFSVLLFSGWGYCTHYGGLLAYIALVVHFPFWQIPLPDDAHILPCAAPRRPLPWPFLLLLLPAAQPLPSPLCPVSTNGLSRDTHHMARCDKRGNGWTCCQNSDPLRFIFASPGRAKKQGRESIWEYGLYYDLIIDPAAVPDCSLQRVAPTMLTQWRSSGGKDTLFPGPFLYRHDSPCIYFLFSKTTPVEKQSRRNDEEKRKKKAS